MRNPVSKGLMIVCLGAALACPAAETSEQVTDSDAPEPPKPDKSQFTLFNPTPRELMRPLSADRPDKTESAYTVDAGHYQVEMDILSYSYDRHNPEHANVSAEGVGIASMNLKVGLLHNWDLQLMVPAYNSLRVHDKDTGDVETRRGFGDLALRTKVNLWGNDEGTTALAMMPFVKFPTANDGLGNGSFEGGIMFPFAANLPAGWGLGTTTELDVARNNGRRGYHAEYLQTIAFGHEIYGPLSGYVEFFSVISSERHSDWIATGDVGLTWLLTEDIQLDMGVNLGITRAADDVNPFVGLTMRF